MTSHLPFDRRDFDFLLHEVEDVASLCRHPRFAGHSRETFDATLDLAAELAMAKFASHNRASDNEEPRFVDGRVEIIPAVKDALDAFLKALKDNQTKATAYGAAVAAPPNSTALFVDKLV